MPNVWEGGLEKWGGERYSREKEGEITKKEKLCSKPKPLQEAYTGKENLDLALDSLILGR